MMFKPCSFNIIGCQDDNDQHEAGCNNWNNELNEADRTDYPSEDAESENSDMEIDDEENDDNYDPKDDNYDLSEDDDYE